MNGMELNNSPLLIISQQYNMIRWRQDAIKIPDSSNIGRIDLRSSALAFFQRSVQGIPRFVSIPVASSSTSVVFSSNYNGVE